MRASRERGRCVQRSASPSKDALVVTHTHQTQHTLSASKLARLLRRHVVARLRVPAVDKPARRRVEVDDRHAHVVPFGVIKVCVCVASACVLSCERVCVQSAAAAAAAAAAAPPFPWRARVTRPRRAIAQGHTHTHKNSLKAVADWRSTCVRHAPFIKDGARLVLDGYSAR